MSVFEEIHPLNAGVPVTRQSSGNAAQGPASNPPSDPIPARYRDGRGGINLEQVRRDQLRARQEWLRAVVRSIKALWGR
ncbi:MAG: hypothetical protein MI745_09030 [Pseudomonadales bacterium]|nr:hypothetical protein [Pseudomonadales bacterium]